MDRPAGTADSAPEASNQHLTAPCMLTMHAMSPPTESVWRAASVTLEHARAGTNVGAAEGVHVGVRVGDDVTLPLAVDAGVSVLDAVRLGVSGTPSGERSRSQQG